MDFFTGAEERRKENRRQSDRQGKYDRRRNRCIHCRFFQGDASAEMGWCLHHQSEMAPQAFACPHFDKVP
jgi:hypothetical protein